MKQKPKMKVSFMLMMSLYKPLSSNIPTLRQALLSKSFSLSSTQFTTSSACPPLLTTCTDIYTAFNTSHTPYLFQPAALEWARPRPGPSPMTTQVSGVAHPWNTAEPRKPRRKRNPKSDGWMDACVFKLGRKNKRIPSPSALKWQSKLITRSHPSLSEQTMPWSAVVLPQRHKAGVGWGEPKRNLPG